ncbi:MAG: tetraacyldisaccharide 4'-kinase [Elusimicrobia bacterium]|nr:tetraacyldisaccharide 4'-kinase [Elusimicrobiota bacterium]
MIPEYLIQYWQSLIAGENAGFTKKIQLSALQILAFFYGTITSLRNRAYDKKIRVSRKVPVPVLSIGNLSVGGSGKTTLVLECAHKILRQKRKPVILSRGYMRDSSQNVVMVSDGKKKLADPSLCGDEPLLLSQNLPGVPVIVGSDRVQTAEIALQQFKPDCLILDDGFQHRRIHRDWDSVSLDESLTRFPYLLPRGVMRENIKSLQRAHFIFVKTDLESEKKFLESFQETFSFPLRSPFASFSYQSKGIREHRSGEIFATPWLRDKRLFLLSALANPTSFETLVKNLGGNIVRSFRFRDHHSYRSEELEAIRKQAEKESCFILITEKDAVKIPNSYPAYTLLIQVQWGQGEEILERSLAGVFS